MIVSTIGVTEVWLPVQLEVAQENAVAGMAG